MHTKDQLADALQQVGLTAMATKAREGYYHDFLSPLDLPQIALVNGLAVAAADHPDNESAIMELRGRVINGEFDASAEESEEWAAGPEGQDAFRSLMGKK
jgi:hypothetical protein